MGLGAVFNSKENMMAKLKFTPRPLTATQNETVKGLWDVRSDRDFLGVAFDENAQANAELMADAPRLLEVLDTLYDCVDHEKLLPSQLDVYHQARELLAKHGG
jgi:hypothetical protein